MDGSPDVIIVGAGPSGLTVALQLAAYGIRFRLFDQKDTFSENSRAVGIQARSLELFEQMGLINDIIARGRKAYGLDLHTASRILQIDIFRSGRAKTAYPFVFLLEQNETEKILSRHLNEAGARIEWNAQVIGVELQEDRVRVRVQKHGVEETVLARWLIAADGAGSFIRESLKVPFVGGTYEQNFAVVDVKAVEGRLEQDHVNLNFNPSGFVLLLPLAAKGVYRLITNFPPSLERKEPAFEDIQRHVAKVFPGGLRIARPEWYSNFRIQSRSVQRFRHGPVFFVGDAAHIHSPVGAQGMNTGIQDASNLAWKLALAVKGALPEQALDTYHQERFPIAQRLLATTDRIFQLAARRNAFLTALRMYVFPYLIKLLTSLPSIRQWAFCTISQLGIRYDAGMLIPNETGDFPYSAPRPGQRLPYVHFEKDGQRLSSYELFAYHHHHLLLFARDQAQRRLAEQTAADIEQNFAGIVAAHIVLPGSPETTAAGNKLWCDEATFAMFATKAAPAYLIRPDMYLALRTQWFAPAEVRSLLHSYLRRDSPTQR